MQGYHDVGGMLGHLSVGGFLRLCVALEHGDLFVELSNVLFDDKSQFLCIRVASINFRVSSAAVYTYTDFYRLVVK